MRVCHETLRRPGESLAVSSLDPAAIAQGVRQIAHDLHQILRKTTPSPGELIELERRIDELRVHTHGTGLIAIDCWLASSQSAIRAPAVAEQKNSVWLHEAFAIGQPDCGDRRLECKRCRGSRLQQA